MKWRKSWLFPSLLLTLLLVGCSQTAFEASSYDEEEINQLPGVTMETAKPAYPEGTETIEVVIKNETAEELFYGVAFAVEYLEGEKWVVYPFGEDMMWIEIAMILSPNSQNVEELKLTLLKNEPKAGTYRIIKTIAGETLAAEFEIE